MKSIISRSEIIFKSTFFKSSFGSIIVRISAALVAVISSVVLARALGAHNYGIYAFVLSLVLITSVPAHMGLPNLVVRETAVAHSREDWGRIKGVWIWATKVALAISFAIASGGALFVLLWGGIGAERAYTIAWGLLLIPMIAIGTLRGAALRGLRKPVLGQLPYQIIRPVLLTLAVALLAFGLQMNLSAAAAMAIHAGASFLAFVAGVVMLWRARPRAMMSPDVVPVYASRDWIRSVVPFSLIAGMSLLNQNIGVLMLGVFTDAASAGIFQVAIQGGLVLVLGQTALDMVVAPRFARLHANGETVKLQRLVSVSACASLALAAPVAVVYMAFGGPLLRIVFGPDFREGAMALAIIAVGQLINSAFGSVNALLNMSGFERDTARSLLIAGVGHIGMTLALVPAFGLLGAAVSASITLALWNVLQWWMVRKRLKVESTVFGSVRVIRDMLSERRSRSEPNLEGR